MEGLVLRTKFGRTPDKVLGQPETAKVGGLFYVSLPRTTLPRSIAARGRGN